MVSQEDDPTIAAAVRSNMALKKLNFSQSKDFAVTTLFSLVNQGAAKVSTTPHAFVFGKDGKAVWHGEPCDHLCELYLSKLDD